VGSEVSQTCSNSRGGGTHEQEKEAEVAKKPVWASYSKSGDSPIDYTQQEDYEEKRKALNKWFRAADADGSGELSVHEVNMMINGSNTETLDMHKVMQILEELDSNGDGKLSPGEFNHAFMALSLVSTNRPIWYTDLPHSRQTASETDVTILAWSCNAFQHLGLRHCRYSALPAWDL
jgi:hypothetical protein